MKKVLFGSAAAYVYFPDFRQPKDLDYLIDGKGYSEILNTLPSSRPGIEYKVEYYDCNRGVGIRKLFDDNESILSPTQLYTLKVSHSFWSETNFAKTMHDIAFFQQKGLTLDDELYTMLYDDWTKIHRPKKAYLDKSNEEFFQDGVKRQYIHDDIHRAISYYDEPMFMKLKKNPESAIINKDLFFGLSHADRLRTCREELYVTALERFIIPNNYRYSTLVAYKKSYELLVTSMTKGFFARYLVENWLELHKLEPDYNFVLKFKEFVNAD